MKLKPKECIHNGCKNIFYVPDNKLHMMLNCEKCIEISEQKFKQNKVLDSFVKDGFFKCPSCKESWTPNPSIENAGENKTQIYCGYGCGYIFLDDYKQNKDELGPRN